MTQAELETPHDPAEIYDAQTPENTADLVNRPLFTGDIAGEHDGSALCLVQHPCAMRKGTSLLPSLLVCSVVDSGAHRTQWRNHTPTEMPLPASRGLQVSLDAPDQARSDGTPTRPARRSGPTRPSGFQVTESDSNPGSAELPMYNRTGRLSRIRHPRANFSTGGSYENALVSGLRRLTSAPSVPEGSRLTGRSEGFALVTAERFGKGLPTRC